MEKKRKIDLREGDEDDETQIFNEQKSKVLLRFIKVTKNFGSYSAVNSLSLDLHQD